MQSSALSEKFEASEHVNKESKEGLTKVEDEGSALLARTKATEETQQASQDEFCPFQNSHRNGPLTGLADRLYDFEPCLESKTDEDQNDSGHLRWQQDALNQRLRSSEVGKMYSWEEMLRPYATPDCEVRLSRQHSDILAKAHIVTLEIQLNAACAARNQALRQVERLTEKFEAASKAVYELDAARKAEVSQLEAKLMVASQKLASYEQVEAELDRAIERFTSTEVMEKGEGQNTLLYLTNLFESDGMPLLPTLASRRLEHCIKISRQLAKSEELRHSLVNENKELKVNLEATKTELSRLSELLANLDKSPNCLASALVARDSRINDLQMAKHKLESKLRRLYDCTKNIVMERDAMISDLRAYFEVCGCKPRSLTSKSHDLRVKNHLTNQKTRPHL
ncbi:unnamed protein product [Hydatigera taeniaeformis]|uniref:Uncharacterized protein n=1 Tax=Hydatigena taeniaeformis TaxID=6205 RepID=A0A3P7FPL1_HYDTA|nr:unnamed protein product [Hydatigera taeniaeformis]